MARILLVDNFDSFTYILVQYFEELGQTVEVVRNDEHPELDCDAVVISPGPGTPAEAGFSNTVLRMAPYDLPILGVCLGHQCITEQFGGRVVRAAAPMHGKTSEILHDGSGLFTGLPSPLRVTRYHSLIAERSSFPADLEVTACTTEGEIMALQHRSRPIYGVQFHPESVLTECGRELLRAFVQQCPRH